MRPRSPSRGRSRREQSPPCAPSRFLDRVRASSGEPGRSLRRLAEGIGIQEIGATPERLRRGDALADEGRRCTTKRLGAQLKAAAGEASEALAFRGEDAAGLVEL